VPVLDQVFAGLATAGILYGVRWVSKAAKRVIGAVELLEGSAERAELCQASSARLELVAGRLEHLVP
jgi:hypothetical protein